MLPFARYFSKSFHQLTSLYLKQVGANVLIKMASILVSLLYVPLALRFLDQERYGVWLTIIAIVNWIRILDVGVGNGLRNKLSQCFANKDAEMARIYISTSYAVLGSVLLAVMAAILLLNPWLDWQGILNTKSIANEELALVAGVAIAAVIIAFIMQMVIAVYDAHGNTAFGAVVQLLISILSLALIWLATFTESNHSLLVLAGIVTGVPVVVYLGVTIYTFYGPDSSLRPHFGYIHFKDSKNLLQLSAQFFVVQITSTIIFASIPFVVAQLFGSKAVAQFSIATSIFNLPIMLISLISAPVLPLVTRAFTNHDFTWLRSTLRKLCYVSIGLAGFTIVLIWFAPLIYRVWLGDAVEIPVKLSIAIGIYSIINILVQPFSIFLNGLGKIKMLVKLAPVGVAMFFGGSLFLAHWLQDVMAVSLALSLTSLVGLVVIPLQIKKII